MSVGTAVAEGDWSVPATRGELMSVKHDLKRKIDRLDSKIDRVASDLKSEIEEVRSEIVGVRADLKVGLKDVRADLKVGLKDVQVSLVRIVWTAVATLGAVGILLRFF